MTEQEIYNEQFVLVIYKTVESDIVLHDLIGSFSTDESAYLYVDQIREELDGSGIQWSYSVWDLTKPKLEI